MRTSLSLTPKHPRRAKWLFVVWASYCRCDNFLVHLRLGM
jgi:hypothetical protein